MLPGGKRKAAKDLLQCRLFTQMSDPTDEGVLWCSALDGDLMLCMCERTKEFPGITHSNLSRQAAWFRVQAFKFLATSAMSDRMSCGL